VNQKLYSQHCRFSTPSSFIFFWTQFIASSGQQSEATKNKLEQFKEPVN